MIGNSTIYKTQSTKGHNLSLVHTNGALMACKAAPKRNKAAES